MNIWTSLQKENFSGKQKTKIKVKDRKKISLFSIRTKTFILSKKKQYCEIALSKERLLCTYGGIIEYGLLLIAFVNIE
jgi:hypothetical protein